MQSCADGSRGRTPAQPAADPPPTHGKPAEGDGENSPGTVVQEKVCFGIELKSPPRLAPPSQVTLGKSM